MFSAAQWMSLFIANLANPQLPGSLRLVGASVTSLWARSASSFRTLFEWFAKSRFAGHVPQRSNDRSRNIRCQGSHMNAIRMLCSACSKGRAHRRKAAGATSPLYTLHARDTILLNQALSTSPTLRDLYSFCCPLLGFVRQLQTSIGLVLAV
jgi:hypothetical protein